MSYQVIARKYRPQRFADVVGQEHVTQTLSNAIAQSRIAHAYLFCGPRGTGKTTIARIFAKCLNCTGGPMVDFPDDDPKCVEIAEGRALDVLEIDGASNRGIDEVRELRETVKYAPASSRFKVYIVDEVHMLTKEAFNALLKTLEEPPAHVKFMFATTEPEKVLPTILSRCQRFDLRRIPSRLIVKHLTHIAGKEGVKIDGAALHAIARGAEGCMRDAESTLDQLISFCGEQIVEADVLSMFGLTARGQILSLSRAILAGEIDKALRELDELARNGKDLGRLLGDLLNHFRNLLIYQVSRGDVSLLDVSEEEAAALAEQSATLNSGALTRVMEVLTDAEGRLRDAASKRIMLEVTLLKAIQARSAMDLDSVLNQLKQLRAGNGVPASAAPAPVPASAAAPAPASSRPAPLAVPTPPRQTPVAPPALAPAPTILAETPASTSATGELDLADLWSKVVEAVGRASPFARSYLLEAHPVSLVRNVFTIGFDPEFADHVGLVDNAKNRALIQTKLKELGAGEVLIKFIVAEAPVQAAAPTPAAPVAEASPASVEAAVAPPPAAEPVRPRERTSNKTLTQDDFKNDPLIKKALEIFKGQLVEVRS
ncbi:MAG: DNA polymerase III subunit gamma/tau [Verrucomicrobia bacterium]|nr:DNA polymerase III subunit gamma/tau [Verrucomicrobiota bacterium]